MTKTVLYVFGIGIKEARPSCQELIKKYYKSTTREDPYIITMGLFRKKRVSASAEKSSNPMDAIQKIRSSIENSDKRQVYLQRKIDRLVPEAKSKLARGDKRGALSDMKRKKMFQAEIEKLDNVKMTLEMQAMQIETATHNQETVGAMQTGNSAMQRLRKAFGVDKVDDLMDDIREEAETAQEISSALANPLDPYMMDDDDLMRELNELMDDGTRTTKKQSSTATTTTGLSSFFAMPSRTMTQKQKEMHDLKALEAELVSA